MNIIQKDITTIPSGTIIHQVNCQGAMGSGVALALRRKWPQIYDSYIGYIGGLKTREYLLGSYDLCLVEPNIMVINAFCQLDYRKSIDDHFDRFTSYAAWETVLGSLNKIKDSSSFLKPVYFPYNVGCDRGGGDFRVISAMIEEVFPDAIFCRI